MATFQALYDDALHTELGTNDTAVLFTSARRKHQINEGMRQFAALTECSVRQSTISVSTSAQEYNLNSSQIIADQDFLKMAAQGPVFQISGSNGLVLTLEGPNFPQVSIPFLDNARVGWRSTVAAYPDGWYLREDGGANYIGLPNPVYLANSSQTAKILLPYVAKPSSMTSDTALPFTYNGLTRHDLEPYHQAAVHFAAHRLEKLRKDKEASDEQLKAFMGYVQRYQDDKRPRGQRVVRAAVNYFKRSRGRGDRGGLLVPEWYR